MKRFASKPSVEAGTACHPCVAPGSGLALHSSVLHGCAPNRSGLECDVVAIQFGMAASALRHQASETLSLSNRTMFLNCGAKPA